MLKKRSVKERTNMLDFTKYFGHTYVINLPRREDRLVQFNDELVRINASGVTVFPAVDGRDIENDTPLLDGELGILETHIKILTEAKERGYDSILVLEDDVRFNDNVEDFDVYFNQVPKDWDLLYLGGNHTYGLPLHIHDRNVAKLNYTVALQSVAINKTMYDVLLEVLRGRVKQVDTYYAMLQSVFNAYGFIPNMTRQYAGHSDIQNRYVNYDNYFN